MYTCSALQLQWEVATTTLHQVGHLVISMKSWVQDAPALTTVEINRWVSCAVTSWVLLVSGSELSVCINLSKSSPMILLGNVESTRKSCSTRLPWSSLSPCPKGCDNCRAWMQLHLDPSWHFHWRAGSGSWFAFFSCWMESACLHRKWACGIYCTYSGMVACLPHPPTPPNASQAFQICFRLKTPSQVILFNFQYVTSELCQCDWESRWAISKSMNLVNVALSLDLGCAKFKYRLSVIRSSLFRTEIGKKTKATHSCYMYFFLFPQYIFFEPLTCCHHSLLFITMRARSLHVFYMKFRNLRILTNVN